jgi:hypothetical protein
VSNLVPRKETIDGKKPIDGNEITLTMAKLKLQWLINRHKANPDRDYRHEILFAKFKLERVSGKKVKMRI